MTYLAIESLTRRFGEAAGVFDLSLSLEQGKTLALLGPSGSGKTTTLRVLGGFERPDTGRILVDGEDMVPLRPEQRRFGMVFQHYALFPHLDVGQNVLFGLESLGVSPADAVRRVSESLALVDLVGFERRRIGELSGGQQQRVALARALAPEPRILLLDEPLSNLDPALRERTRRELRSLLRRVGITTVIVTHEQDDAFDLGDQVAVLREGRLEQAGAPEALYREPATPFVGTFIGRASWLTGTATGEGTVVIEGAHWPLAAPAAREPGKRIRLLVRPEALRFAPLDTPGLAVTITDRRFAGSTTYFLAATAAGTVVEVSANPDAATVGRPAVLVPVADPADRESLVRCFAEETR